MHNWAISIIIIQIRKLVDYCFRYERFINFWLRFFDTRRETKFLKVFANHTMLTILSDHPQRAAYLVMFKISIHLPRSRSEKLNCRRNGRNSTLCLNGRNSTLSPWSNLNWLFFKILKFSGPSLPGMTSSILQPYFLSGCLLWQWWLSYHLRTSVNCTK